MIDMNKRIARESGYSKKIVKIVEPIIEKIGFQLVCINILNKINFFNIQIMVENKIDGTLNINDCVLINNVVLLALKNNNLIDDKCSLEISSPGILRLLVRPIDFERNIGFYVKVELLNSIKKCNFFIGKIKGFDIKTKKIKIFIKDNDSFNSQIISLDFNNIKKANLIVNDDF